MNFVEKIEDRRTKLCCQIQETNGCLEERDQEEGRAGRAARAARAARPGVRGMAARPARASTQAPPLLAIRRPLLSVLKTNVPQSTNFRMTNLSRIDAVRTKTTVF